MFEKLRRNRSEEPKPENRVIIRIDDRLRQREVDEVLHPGLHPRMQQILREQNDDEVIPYHDALSKQKGERLAADG